MYYDRIAYEYEVCVYIRKQIKDRKIIKRIKRITGINKMVCAFFIFNIK